MPWGRTDNDIPTANDMVRRAIREGRRDEERDKQEMRIGDKRRQRTPPGFYEAGTATLEAR